VDPRPLQRFGLRADARATGDGRGLPALPGHGRVAVPGGRAPLPAQTSRRGGTADRDGPGATVYSRDGLDRTADLPLPAVLERRVSPVRAADAHPRYRAPQRHPVRAQAGNQAPPAEQAAPLCRAGGPAHGGGDPRAHHRRRRRLPPRRSSRSSRSFTENSRSSSTPRPWRHVSGRWPAPSTRPSWRR